MRLTNAKRVGEAYAPYVPKGGGPYALQTIRSKAHKGARASAGDTAWYRPVLERDVPAGVRGNAERTLCDVAAWLDLPSGTAMAWFEPCNQGDEFAFRAARQLAGLCPQDGGKIYLNANLGIAAVRETVAHELRHEWQIKTRLPGGRAEHEYDAYAFAAKWMNR